MPDESSGPESLVVLLIRVVRIIESPRERQEQPAAAAIQTRQVQRVVIPGFGCSLVEMGDRIFWRIDAPDEKRFAFFP